MVKPFGHLVPVGSHVAMRTPPAYHQVVFLGPYSSKADGDLILGGASRLDAFSAYPGRT